MTWQEGFAVLQLVAEEAIGVPMRQARAEENAREDALRSAIERGRT